MQYVLWAILIYVLYQFVTKFVIPVFRVGRQMKKQVNTFKSQMEEQFRQQQGYQQSATHTQGSPSKSRNNNVKGEYIDFEEIK